MKKLIQVLAAFALFGTGFASGYFVRKRSEVTFEEVTEEELAAMAEKDAQNASESPSEAVKAPSSDIHGQGVSQVFKAAEEPILSGSEGIGKEQKIAYFKQWKNNEEFKKYDTTAKEEPSDVVAEVEDLPDDEFFQAIEEDIKNGVDRPEIEAGTIDEWNHWIGTPDGEYDPIEIRWYEHDNIFCDSNDEVMERPEKFIGFDIRKQFENIDAETSGDPDVRILINHRFKAIYHVTRIFGSWKKKRKYEEFGGEMLDDEDDEDDEDDIYDRFRGLRN